MLHFKNNGGVGLSLNSNGGVIDGVRFHNVGEDPMYQLNGNMASLKPHRTKVVKNVWVTHSPASFLENDHVANLLVDDVLVDGTFSGLSVDPAQDYGPRGTVAQNKVTMTNKLIRLRKMADSKVSTTLVTDYLTWLKGRRDFIPEYEIHNTIFATDGWSHSEPIGNSARHVYERIKECSNNAVFMDVRQAASLEFSDPSLLFQDRQRPGSPRPMGRRKANWINCHPKLERVPGDPASNYSKCDESAYGGGGAGTPMGGGTTGGTGGSVIGACNLFQAGEAPQSGYGAAWNPFSTPQGLLLNSHCRGTSAELRVGIAPFQTQYVYKMGYVYAGGWQPFALTGAFVNGSTDWLQGQGSYDYQNPPTGTTFWVGYMCHWDTINLKWNCGCADAACTTPYWQLQGVVR